MIKKYKAIFFDAGGTLFFPYPSVGKIYQETAQKYGCKVDADILQKLFRDGWLKRDGLTHLVSHSSEKKEREWWHGLVKEVFDQIGGIQDFESFFDELYDLFARPDVWRVYEDVEEVLKKLKKEKKSIGIVSNWDSRLFHLIEGLKLSHYFDFVLASAVFGAAKPNPKIFKEALLKAGVRPEEAVHIGDSFEDDVRGAKSVGIQAVLIHRDHKREIAHPDFINLPTISSLKELFEL